MTIRNDTGSEFIAKVFREYLREKGVYQECSHLGSPEDNAYIEALHSILQREVSIGEFDSSYHAEMVIGRYYKWYSEKWRHWSLDAKMPARPTNYI